MLSVAPSLFASVIGAYLAFLARPNDSSAGSSSGSDALVAKAKTTALRTVSQLILSPQEEKGESAQDVLAALLKSEAFASTLPSRDRSGTSVIDELGDVLLLLLERILAGSAGDSTQSKSDHHAEIKLVGLLIAYQGQPHLSAGQIAFANAFSSGSLIAHAASSTAFGRAVDYCFDAGPKLLTSSTPITAQTLSTLVPILVVFVSSERKPNAYDEGIMSLMATIFLLAFVGSGNPSATDLWNTWRREAGNDAIENVAKRVHDLIRVAIGDVEGADPSGLFDLALKVASFDPSGSSPFDALPSRLEYETDLSKPVVSHFPSSLAVIDPMISSNASPYSTTTVSEYDAEGFTSLARTRLALLHLVTHDRRSILDPSNTWIIPQLIALECAARDWLALPSSSSSPYFAPMKTTLHDMRPDVNVIVSRTQQALAYAFASLGADLGMEWHRRMTGTLRSAKGASTSTSPGLGELAEVVVATFSAAQREKGGGIWTRVLPGLLRGLIREAEAGVEVGDAWLVVAQSHIDSGKRGVQAMDHRFALTSTMDLSFSSPPRPRNHPLRDKPESRITTPGPDPKRTSQSTLRYSSHQRKHRGPPSTAHPYRFGTVFE